jgi:hypothetical protein
MKIPALAPAPLKTSTPSDYECSITLNETPNYNYDDDDNSLVSPFEEAPQPRTNLKNPTKTQLNLTPLHGSKDSSPYIPTCTTSTTKEKASFHHKMALTLQLTRKSTRWRLSNPIQHDNSQLDFELRYSPRTPCHDTFRFFHFKASPFFSICFPIEGGRSTGRVRQCGRTILQNGQDHGVFPILPLNY